MEKLTPLDLIAALEAKHNVVFSKNISEINLIYDICFNHSLPFTWERDNISPVTNPVFDKNTHKPPHKVLYDGKEYIHIGSFQKKGGAFFYKYRLVTRGFKQEGITVDHDTMCALPSVIGDKCGFMDWETLYNLGIIEDYYTERLKSRKLDSDGFRSSSTHVFVRYKGKLHIF